MVSRAVLAGLSLSALALGGAASLAVPAIAQKQSLAMLDGLQGGWDLRERGGPVRGICLDSGRRLIQLRHPGMPCSSVVVEDRADEVTVQYTCRGQGYGRTHIRRESDALIQVDSQGIVNGLPFSFSAEGRRTGDCRS